MASHAIDPNHRIDGMPLLHIALEAEVERGIFEVDSGHADYSPSGDCLRVLFELGADASMTFHGETVFVAASRHSALNALSLKMEQWALRGEARA